MWGFSDGEIGDRHWDLESNGPMPSCDCFSPYPMLVAFKRFLALFAVFLVFFLFVSGLRTWRAGGDFSALLPDLLKRTPGNRKEAFTPSEQSALKLGDVEILSRLNEEYAKLTKAVVPSVVSIDTSGMRTEKLIDIFGQNRKRNYPTQGQGSGVIVSKEGHVITNHHVIAGQNKIRITLHGGKTYGASLIGEDPLLDIAVIKIDSDETFIPLKLGDSSLAQVGQIVFAVGNPFGLGETVTQGIISAKERTLADNQRDLLQTDTPINPGNSGGPLVNIMGEIIGINAVIVSENNESPGFQGVGFSIPSNNIREALGQIIERGRPIRGFLGVNMEDLTSSSRARLAYEGSGSVVIGTTPGSPAEKAGLRAGDIIFSYGGTPIENLRQLIILVQRSEVGETIPIKVWREGRAVELKASIGEALKPFTFTRITPDQAVVDNAGLISSIGIVVRNLDPRESLQGLTGVVITSVSPEGPAAGLLVEGDLIYSLNNSLITNRDIFYLDLAASAAVQATSFKIIRDGRRMQVNLPGPSGAYSLPQNPNPR